MLMYQKVSGWTEGLIGIPTYYLWQNLSVNRVKARMTIKILC